MVIIEDVNQKIGKHTEKNEYWQKMKNIVCLLSSALNLKLGER